MNPLFLAGGALVLFILIIGTIVGTVKRFLITPETYNAYLKSSGKKGFCY